MTGRLVGWSHEQYHTDREWLNSTRIKTFAESREKYADEYETDDPPKRPVSEALMFGSAVHSAVNGEQFLTCAHGYRTKAFAGMVEANPWQPIIPESDVERVMATREAVLANATARELIYAPGHSEQTILWEDEITGMKLKCRLDRLLDDGCIPDLKTTRDVDKFGHAIHDFQYELQAAHYCRGAQSILGYHPRFVFIAVESCRPHRVRCVTLPSDVHYDALGRLDLHLTAMAKCRETGDYTDRESHGVHEAVLPAWHYKKYGIEG